MKYLGLIYAGLFRKKLRTFLTLASLIARYRKFKRPFRRVCRVGGGRASGGLGKDRACASALRHHLGAQSGRPWPFLTESRPFDRLRTGVGPNAPLRDRRRI